MKRFCLILVWILLLAGCAGRTPPQPEPEPTSPPAQTQVPVPTQQPEAIADPAPITVEPLPEPELPAVEEPALPDLPYPAYCWGNTAVSGNGSVILQVPDHTLSLCFDAVTGKPAGILAQSDRVSQDLPTAYYSLDGSPLLTDTPLAGFQTTGDLYWYLQEGGWTLRRFSDGAILADSLRTIEPVGTRLLTQAMFWNAPCVLLDPDTAEPVLELPRGFQLYRLFQDGNDLYLALESVVDGTRTLVDWEGRPRLDGFHEIISSAAFGRAVTVDRIDGQLCYSVVDLQAGAVLLREQQPVELLEHALLVTRDGGRRLVDLQGQPLSDHTMHHASPCDLDADGRPELIVGTILRDGSYSTVLLLPDGTELAVLPTEDTYVFPLSTTKFVYAVFTGEAALQQQLRLLDLDRDTDIPLSTETLPQPQLIETSGGQMILCGGRLFLNDGTPARTDLGSCRYLGGDVFACTEGLRCLDGTWLYRPDE